MNHSHHWLKRLGKVYLYWYQLVIVNRVVAGWNNFTCKPNQVIHKRHLMGPTPSCLMISALFLRSRYHVAIIMDCTCSIKWIILDLKCFSMNISVSSHISCGPNPSVMLFSHAVILFVWQQLKLQTPSSILCRYWWPRIHDLFVGFALS